MTKCDMTKECSEPITHIGEKGFVYCAAHAIGRRQSGFERTRKLRIWELKLIETGKALPSYKPIRKPTIIVQPTVEWLAAKFQAVIIKNHYSPKMAALVGAVIGHDFGVRDGFGHQVTSLSITADGFVIGHTPDPDSSSFIGSADDLARNLALLIADANLNPEETKLYGRLYDTNVKDWRN